jgi:hypothetical protein
MEVYDGRLYWSHEQRMYMLALLLENVGMDAAVTLGDAELWRAAVEARLKREA